MSNTAGSARGPAAAQAWRHGPTEPALPALLLLLLLLLFPAATSGSEPSTSRASVSELVARSNGTGKLLVDTLQVSYDDRRRLKWRPLLHLSSNPDAGRAYDLEPRGFILSAHLDTRPLYYGQPALLRVLGARHNEDAWQALLSENGTLAPFTAPRSTDGYVIGRGGRGVGLYCRWVCRGGDVRTSLAKVQLIMPRNNHTWRESLWTCPTDITSMQMMQDVTYRPLFATLVDEVSQDLGPYALMGHVHVNIIPILHDHRGVKEGGPARLTRDMYHQGRGGIAVCTSPFFHAYDGGPDIYAPYLPEWVAFVKAAGASRIISYVYSAGPLTRSLLSLFEKERIFKVYEWLLSRRIWPTSVQKQCSNPSGVGPVAPMLEEWTQSCQPAERPMFMSHHGQLAALNHCAYRAMGRYRWIVIADFDEWLASRSPAILSWSGLIAHVAASPSYNTTLYKPSAGDRGHRWLSGEEVFSVKNRTFAAGYVFSNVFVCSDCAHQFLQVPANRTAELGPPPGVQMNVTVPPRPGLPQDWLQPRPSMHTAMWRSVVRQSQAWLPCDRSKMIMDPLWVVRVDMHCPPEFWNLTGGLLNIPTEPAVAFRHELALSYHLRTVAAHSKEQLAVMALENRRCGSGLLDSRGFYRLNKCDMCIRDKTPMIDYTIPNLYGDVIAQAVRKYDAAADTDRLCGLPKAGPGRTK